MTANMNRDVEMFLFDYDEKGDLERTPFNEWLDDIMKQNIPQLGFF